MGPDTPRLAPSDQNFSQKMRQMRPDTPRPAPFPSQTGQVLPFVGPDAPLPRNTPPPARDTPRPAPVATCPARPLAGKLCSRGCCKHHPANQLSRRVCCCATPYHCSCKQRAARPAPHNQKRPRPAAGGVCCVKSAQPEAPARPLPRARRKAAASAQRQSSSCRRTAPRCGYWAPAP